jgi:hypothetical protein
MGLLRRQKQDPGPPPQRHLPYFLFQAGQKEFYLSVDWCDPESLDERERLIESVSATIVRLCDGSAVEQLLSMVEDKAVFKGQPNIGKAIRQLVEQQLPGANAPLVPPDQAFRSGR